jgi:heat shock protein HtpX
VDRGVAHGARGVAPSSPDGWWLASGLEHPAREPALDKSYVSRQHLRNLLGTALLLGGLALYVGLLGWVFAGFTGFVASFLLVGVGAWSLTRVPASWILRSSGARPLERFQAPGIVELTTVLAQRAGLPRLPRLYLLPAREPQAMAVGGPDDAAVAVTPALVQRLSPRELAGVLAHEITHLRHGDTRLMAAAHGFGRLASLAGQLGSFMLVANLLLFMLAARWLFHPAVVLLFMLAPTVTGLLRLSLSRLREYEADLGAARLTGDPRGLASALERIELSKRGLLARLAPWVPVPRRQAPALLQTHPPTSERVRRLLALEERRSRPAVPRRGQPVAGTRYRVRRPPHRWTRVQS